MSLQRFLLVLQARWQLVAGVLAGVMVATLLANLLLPRQYTAEAAVVVDSRPADPVLGAILPVAGASSVMATQVDIILSERVAQRAVSRLELDRDEQLRRRWRAETGGQGSFPAWIAAPLKTHLKILPARESNVISIGYTADSPRSAAAVANAFAQAYIDTQLELKVGAAMQYTEWFGERTRSFRDKLEAAQQRLSAYQQSQHIVSADEKLDVETVRLAELSSQLVAAQGQRAEARSRQGQTGAAEILPEVIGNGLIQSLKNRLSEYEAKREQLALRLRETHPEYVDLVAQISVVRGQIARETGRIAGSLGAVDRMNAAREAEVGRALEAQKRKVLDLRAQRDNVAVLQRDVESAQRDYDMVTQRLAQSSLESKTPQTNVSMLTVATEPTTPTSPKVALNTFLSLIFGGLLGIGLALLLEHFNRRLRSAADLPELLDVPVLTVLPERGLTRRRIEPIEILAEPNRPRPSRRGLRSLFSRLRERSQRAQPRRLRAV